MFDNDETETRFTIVGFCPSRGGCNKKHRYLCWLVLAARPSGFAFLSMAV
jgi:hypothetical protein